MLYKNLLIFLLLVLLLFPFAINAQTRKVSFSNGKKLEVKRWEVIDIGFTTKNKPSGNPFDLLFGAVFRGPENETLRIPGFYNGNDEWIIRFSANKTGHWTYTTFSSHTEFSGLTGVMATSENTDPNRHGMVIIDPEKPQNFVYEDGTTYFALAFEFDWLFALDYTNKKDIPKTRQIISDVKENGFNQVVMNVYAYDVNWKTDKDVPAQYEYRKPQFFPFKGTNEKPDFSELNVEFFQHFDRVIQHLDQQGIIAHVMIYVWNKNVNWPEMNSREDNMYFDYIIARYQAFPNIIWDVSKEALDYGRADIPYITERIHRIRNQDAQKRLLTVHDYEYCSRKPEELDFISIQSWRSDLYSLMLEARNIHSNKPVMNIEHGGYEEGPYISSNGNFVNPETCLIRTYECVFAGTYSTYYWQNTSWNIVVYNPFEEGHNFAPPRFDYYKHLATLFKRYDYNELFAPKQKLTINSNEGLDNLSSGGYPLTNGKDLFLFLVPANAYQINSVIPEPESGQMELTWFNPFTGEFKEEGAMAWEQWKTFKTPWKDTYSVAIVKLL